MNDEELVEVMAGAVVGAMWPMLSESERWSHLRAAERGLAALRSVGFQVVGEDDLAGVMSMSRRLVDEVRYFDDHSPAECVVVRTADYAEAALERLVPADSGGSG